MTLARIAIYTTTPNAGQSNFEVAVPFNRDKRAFADAIREATTERLERFGVAMDDIRSVVEIGNQHMNGNRPPRQWVFDVRNLPKVSDDAWALLGQASRGKIDECPGGGRNQLHYRGRMALQELRDAGLIASDNTLTKMGETYPQAGGHRMSMLGFNMYMPALNVKNMDATIEAATLPLPRDIQTGPRSEMRSVANYLNFTPSGVDDQGVADVYSQGKCHVFALAMAEVLGTEKVYVVEDEEAFYENPDDPDDVVMGVLHVYAASEEEADDRSAKRYQGARKNSSPVAYDIFGKRPGLMIEDEVDLRYSRSGTATLMYVDELKEGYISHPHSERGEGMPLCEVTDEAYDAALRRIKEYYPEFSAKVDAIAQRRMIAAVSAEELKVQPDLLDALRDLNPSKYCLDQGETYERWLEETGLDDSFVGGPGLRKGSYTPGTEDLYNAACNVLLTEMRVERLQKESYAPSPSLDW